LWLNQFANNPGDQFNIALKAFLVGFTDLRPAFEHNPQTRNR
jgi:hypothetical protein